MQVLISVIVPIYNVEKYLERCIQSIRNQSYSNLEIILVDDGSTDSSGVLADKFQKRDERIKVIHKNNGGLSDARNVGMKAANGEYLCFIDSDDYIHKDMILTLYTYIRRYFCEVSVCEGVDIYDDCLVEEKLFEIDSVKCDVFNNIDAMKFWYTSSYGNPTVAWNKLYSRSIFDGICFEKGRLHEDEIIMHEVFAKCSHVVYVWKALYFYVNRSNSITQTKYNIKRLDVLYAMENRLKCFKKIGDEELLNMHIGHYCDILMACYINVKYNISGNEEVLNKIYEYLIKLSKESEIDFKHILKVYLFCISPKLYKHIKDYSKSIMQMAKAMRQKLKIE